MPIMLWTDWLVWLLVAAIAGFAFYVARREHLAEPWRRVLKSRSGMVSLVVLSVFVAVGLLDSVHFRPRLPGQAAGANVGVHLGKMQHSRVFRGVRTGSGGRGKQARRSGR